MNLSAAQTLIWHIDRAVFVFDDPAAYATWKEDPHVFFAIRPTLSDDGGVSIFVDPNSVDGGFEITDATGVLKINLEENGPVISAWVLVTAELVEDFDEAALNAWSSENGGWASSTLHLGPHDATLTEDDGGDWRVASDT